MLYNYGLERGMVYWGGGGGGCCMMLERRMVDTVYDVA